MKKTVVILQPSFIPWLGFFDQINRADTFVFLDDVQYTKQDWRNRNRIKSSNGGLTYLTVPIQKAPLKSSIKEIKINYLRGWQKKIIRTLEYNYRKAPYFSEIMELVSEEILRPHTFLWELNISLIKKITTYLELSETLFIKSSDLPINSNSPTERLIKLLLHLKATHYTTGDAAKGYLSEELFNSNGLSLEYQNYQHPIYPQLWGEFSSHLTILDLLFNAGKESRSILCNKASRPTLSTV